ncbi:TlpA family protein disulfide reductase [Parendozoicomonas haliclonae]|uniref:Thiol-disulfide oxidoreductase ResA n=1 Tax=Parendozoicomonas haliclonae TaxID=1960125 RepID=A0A1X7APA3_9GAMM|nr:TlpA disulfide reductase family protein [Parendozoicomonas haliclonae]SMA50116.1 Thiol-disulfide oxidoreductase ResA [Parendozoicomonas haliclonae]
MGKIITDRFQNGIRFLLLSVFIVLAGCGAQEQTQLEDHQGKALQLSAEDSSWLVVNYWATWCDPCREEIPELNELDHEAGVRVWGVDFDNPASLQELQGKIEKMDIEFPVVAPSFVPGLGLEMPPVLPATYIIAPDGTMTKRLIGPQTKDGLLAEIQTLKTKA